MTSRSKRTHARTHTHLIDGVNAVNEIGEAIKQLFQFEQIVGARAERARRKVAHQHKDGRRLASLGETREECMQALYRWQSIISGVRKIGSE